MYYVSTNIQYRAVNLYVYLVSLVYRDIKRPIYVFRILQFRDSSDGFVFQKRRHEYRRTLCLYDPKRIPLRIEREL